MALQILDNTQYNFLVKGDTKPYKEEFKKYGGKWVPTLEAWKFQNNKKMEVTELVNRINSGQLFTPPSQSGSLKPSIPSVLFPKHHNSTFVTPTVPPIKTPNIGDTVIIQVGSNSIQAKMMKLNVNDNIIEMETLEGGQKIYAVIILGKWKIFDPNVVNEVIF